jgi:aryl-alcohol dehydrogenase-like predicted oxidoreductase
VRAILSELGVTEDDMAEVALRFVLSHPAVSTVIPGMRSVRNVERNMAVADGRDLPEDQTRRLKAHRWVRNFYA